MSSSICQVYFIPYYSGYECVALIQRKERSDGGVDPKRAAGRIRCGGWTTVHHLQKRGRKALRMFAGKKKRLQRRIDFFDSRPGGGTPDLFLFLLGDDVFETSGVVRQCRNLSSEHALVYPGSQCHGYMSLANCYIYIRCKFNSPYSSYYLSVRPPPVRKAHYVVG